MPKVSAEHLETRRQQILDAAMNCFVRKGFHQATMQDICDEAELSAGAVYRYFPSKEAIIAACYGSDLVRNTALIERAAERESFTAAIDDMIEAFFSGLIESPSDTSQALEIETLAEAVRNPRIGEHFREFLRGLRGSFAIVVRRAQARGEVSESLDPDAIAAMGMSFYYGLLIQKILDPAVDAGKYVDVMKALLGGSFHPQPVQTQPDQQDATTLSRGQ
ncbi:MAG: TetR/AcrR family transcriptional regulator [Dehalococcoidia bacterium]